MRLSHLLLSLLLLSLASLSVCEDTPSTTAVAATPRPGPVSGAVLHDADSTTGEVSEWPSVDEFAFEVTYENRYAAPAVEEARRAMIREWPEFHIPGMRFERIQDAKHPLKGEHGVFATRFFAAGEVLGEYTGWVKPGTGTFGTYHLALNADPITFPHAPRSMYGGSTGTLDSVRAGNEVPFINDYRGLRSSPNCRIRMGLADGMPLAFYVAADDIREGEEMLVDYGDGYWRFQKKWARARDKHMRRPPRPAGTF